MVLVSTAIRIGRAAIKAAHTYYKAENRLFKYAYQGYPSRVRRGVIHGHIAGSVAGYFLNDDGVDDTEFGFPQAGDVPSTGKYSQTRQGRTRRTTGRYSSKQYHGKGCRQPCPCN